MTALVLVLAGAIVLALFFAGVFSNSTPRTEHVKGGLILEDSDGTGIDFDGSNCFGTNGYEDIDQGASVEITDENGKTLALTQLGPGDMLDSGECTFFFNADVMAGHPYYGVQVTHRGVVKYTEKEIQDGPLVTLGS